MKKDIHPKYHQNIKITCACKASFTAGSTNESLKTEICSQCHPYLTGKHKLIDTAGRVDKFRARQTAAQKHQEGVATKQKSRRKKK